MARSKKTPAVSKLPFIVTPRLQPIKETLGNENTGTIEIERRGYLSVGEKAFMTNVESSDSSVSTIMVLSKKVASKYQIDMNEAYNLVVAEATQQGNSKYNLQEEFEQELAQLLTELIQAEARRSYMKALCLLIYRVNEDVDMASVSAMHPDLVSDFVKLYDEEEARSVDRLESTAKADQDADAVQDVEKK